MIDLSTVVVTGLGTVSAAGCGRRQLEAALRDSTAHWTPVDRSGGERNTVPEGGERNTARLAGLTSGLDLSAWLSPAAARRMSQPSKLAVAAATMALEDAGRSGEPDAEAQSLDRNTAVVVSNAHGPTSLIEGILGQYFRQGPLAVSPALFTESVANAPAAQVAIACRAGGSNNTVIQREAGPLIALAHGAAEIALGRAARAVVLAVDELTPLLHSVLDRFNALAGCGPDGRELARPFDLRRDGYMAAEGAAALVLEHETAARERGAAILARIRSCASAFDPCASRNGYCDRPEILARALSRYLERSGLAPGDIDAVVSGASGAFAGDRLEARVLKAVWGRRPLPPILVPKAVVGEHGGALLAGLVLAAEGAAFGPTPGFSEIDPVLEVVPHDGAPLAPGRVLATGLATGGAAAWAILERGDAT